MLEKTLNKKEKYPDIEQNNHSKRNPLTEDLHQGEGF